MGKKPKNRLNLNWQLQTTQERKEFVDTYISRPEFMTAPLSNSELETIANYILWGKDQDGLNPTQRKEIQIERKNKTWTPSSREESLDALLEAPAFNEDIILKPYQRNYKNLREVFSREDALKNAPPHLVTIFTNLFREIDTIDLTINYYEIRVGKRVKEPRQELLDNLSKEDQEKAYHTAQNLQEYQYLKKKHLLVELRREQYTLRDSYQPSKQRGLVSRGAPIQNDATLFFSYDIPVFPLGIKDNTSSQKLIFQDRKALIPENFTEAELKLTSKVYWDHQELKENLYFDFRELEHVYNLLLARGRLEKTGNDIDELSSNTHFLLYTLDYYIEQVDLNEAYQEILNLKIQDLKNQDIADRVNKKFGKSYTANYISTIFRQKIIKQINEVAAFHEKIISNLPFEEEFKRCSACGEVKLLDSENFTRKRRSSDGFTARCKVCDKKKRQGG